MKNRPFYGYLSRKISLSLKIKISNSKILKNNLQQFNLLSLYYRNRKWLKIYNPPFLMPFQIWQTLSIESLIPNKLLRLLIFAHISCKARASKNCLHLTKIKFYKRLKLILLILLTISMNLTRSPMHKVLICTISPIIPSINLVSAYQHKWQA